MAHTQKRKPKKSPTQDSSATLAELLNVGDTFDYNGDTYTFKELSLARQSEFSQWLKDNAKAEIDRSIELSEETRREMLSVLMEDIAAKKYEYHSKLSVHACKTPEGAAYLLYLGLKDEHPTLTKHEARTMYFEKLNSIAGQILEVIRKDPNAFSPTPSRQSKRYSHTSAKKRGKARRK